MDQAQLNRLINFIWNIADDVLRDIYVRGKYRDVILPMTVRSGLTTVHSASDTFQTSPASCRALANLSFSNALN